MSDLDINEIIANAQSSLNLNAPSIEEVSLPDSQPSAEQALDTHQEEVNPSMRNESISDFDIDAMLAARGLTSQVQVEGPEDTSDATTTEEESLNEVIIPSLEETPGTDFDADTNAATTASQEEIVTIEQSDTVYTRDNDLRFQGAPWYENAKKHVITIVGVGGIGSHAAFLLSRIHPQRIVVWDDDTVETVNMSGQLFSSGDIGLTKVDAVQVRASEFSQYSDIICFPSRFTSESTPTKVMICGLDNMAARKVVFNTWKKFISTLPQEELKECLFIDGRMSAEDIQVFCMTGEDAYYLNKYESEYLFSDEEADTTICSYKQTSFCAAIIGGLISNLYVNFCANLAGWYRRLPFFTEYSAEKFSLKEHIV